MSALRFYKYATWILFSLNLLIIAFLLLHRPPPKGKNPIGFSSATDMLKLDEQQHELFLSSAEKHKAEILRIDKSQKALLHTYFNQLTDSNNAVNSDSLLVEVQKLERSKIEFTTTHLKEIKAILKPEQTPDFEIFMEHILSRILANNKKTPPPPKE